MTENAMKYTRRSALAAGALTAIGMALRHQRRAAGADDEAAIPLLGETDVRIWDNHCHLSGFVGATPADRADALLACADRFGIERLAIYMGWPFVTDPDPAELRRQNDQVLAALEGREDRLMGYVYASGNHPQASVAEIERLVAQGPMVGVKLWVARRCDDAALDQIVDAASAYDAVIFQHTWIKTNGNLPGESTPTDLARLAQRRPRARFICGHAGGNWELGIRAIRGRENVLLGIAGSDPTAGLVEMAVRELGARRIIYGSDVGGRSFASQLGKVLGAEITSDEKRAVLSGNLRRELLPIMQRKGMRTR